MVECQSIERHVEDVKFNLEVFLGLFVCWAQEEKMLDVFLSCAA